MSLTFMTCSAEPRHLIGGLALEMWVLSTHMTAWSGWTFPECCCVHTSGVVCAWWVDWCSRFMLRCSNTTNKRVPENTVLLIEQIIVGGFPPCFRGKVRGVFFLIKALPQEFPAQGPQSRQADNWVDRVKWSRYILREDALPGGLFP